MTVAIAEHDVTVLLGDVREQLATLDAGSVQCVVTSPPYYGLRDYGVDGQIGLEASPAEYVAEMVGVFRDVRRVLADDGVLWLNIGDSYNSAPLGRFSGGGSAMVGRDLSGHATSGAVDKLAASGLPPKNLLGIPWQIAFALQDDGWVLRNEVIWHKTSGMPESITDRLSKQHEQVFLFVKAQRYHFDLDAIRRPAADSSVARARTASSVSTRVGSQTYPGEQRTEFQRWNPENLLTKGANPGTVWSLPTQPFPGAHFATMPAALARRCVLAGCPEYGTVLDPFAGSGTTLMVARQLGRKSIGVELNPQYVDIIRGRIGDTPFDFGEAS